MARKQKGKPSANGQVPRQLQSFKSDHTGPSIRRYEDVADSEDDFETAQDRILLDGQRHDVRSSANDVEASDEEVLALPTADSDEQLIDSSDDLEEEDDDDDDREDHEEDEVGGDYEEGWGDAKSAYYNADDVSDEEDLKAEEEEALRIQKKALSKLNAEDYLDFEDWKDTEADKGDAQEDIEVLSMVVSKDLPKSELIKILHARHPEFTPFALEFQDLYGQVDELEVLAERRFHPQGDLIAAKLSALRNYLGILAFYFALISSANAQAINIKEHEIMDSLVRSREAWTRLSRVTIDKNASDLVKPTTATKSIKAVPEISGRVRKRKRATKSIDSITAPAIQESYAPDSDDELEQTFKSLKSLPDSKSRKRVVTIADNADTVPDQIDAEDAASRRRTLQFYASQIGNKKAKRNVVQSGDADLPYRERKKEREARLQKEAERRRGGRASEGADLDDEDVVSHDPHFGTTQAQKKNGTDKDGTGRIEPQGDGDEEREYYALVAAASAAQKATKKQRHDDGNALVRANRSGYAVPSTLLLSTTNADETSLKRGIGREIASNKGLTTRKPKENRNARVKKRVKYDAAKKKLASQKAVYKGPPVAAYAGEATGINQRVIKSTRLDQGSDRRR